MALLIRDGDSRRGSGHGRSYRTSSREPVRAMK